MSHVVEKPWFCRVVFIVALLKRVNVVGAIPRADVVSKCPVNSRRLSCLLVVSVLSLLSIPNIADDWRVVCESYLGEQLGPDGLNLDVGSLDQGVDLVGRDLNAVVSEDQRRIGRGKLSSRHLERFVWLLFRGMRKREVVDGL